MGVSQEAKKAKKAARQKAAAEANARRAAAFKAALAEGRDPNEAAAAVEDPHAPLNGKKRKSTEDVAHELLAAAVAEGEQDAAAKKAAKRAAKRAKKAAAAGDGENDSDASVERPATPGVPGEPIAKAAAKLTEEEVAAYREEHAIKVAQGTPDPITRFDDAPFPRKLVAALLKQGYESPTPIQAQAWPIAVKGKDVIAIAKTGSGKTCGFLLPALAKIVKQGATAAPDMEMVDGRFRPAAVVPHAIVLAPTRELAIQIGDECAKFCPAAGAKVVTLYGGASKGDQLRALRSGADVLVATPGRLHDFLAPPPGFSAPVSARNASYVVLDEADRMLDMGFEPQIKKIIKMCPTARQTLMFTATWPDGVRKIADTFLQPDAALVRIGDGGDRLTANKSITQTIEIVTEDQKLDRAIAVLKENLVDGARGIVFCGTKRRCDFIDRKMKAMGLRSAGAIHGDKDQAEREYSLDLFRKGKAPLLVATDVAARGLDIPGVTVVLVYDFPLQVEDYVHRIGRTGRAGKEGKAHCFFTEEDAGAARELVQILEGAEQDVPERLREMADRSRKSFKGKGGRGGGRGGRGGGRGRGGFGGRGGGGRGGGGRGGGRGGFKNKW